MIIEGAEAGGAVGCWGGRHVAPTDGDWLGVGWELMGPAETWEVGVDGLACAHDGLEYWAAVPVAGAPFVQGVVSVAGFFIGEGLD